MNRKQRRADKKQGGAAPQGVSSRKPDSVFAEALQQHQSGRFTDAERLYREVLKADPRHPYALHGLGVLALQAGRGDIAADLIGKAIAQNPREPVFHSNFGGALRAQGKLNEAIASYQRALDLKPDHADGHYKLGNAFQDQGRLDEAIASYRQALTLQPGFAEAHGNLGNALKRQGKLDEAVASYRRVLALKPNFAEMHGNLGHTLQDQGKLNEAVASFRQALALKPGFAALHSDLGVALRDQGKLDEAVAAYQRALALEPGFSEAHYNLGNAFQDQGRLDEAVACFERALALKPRYAEAHDNLLMTLNYKDDVSIANLYATAKKFGAIFDRSSAHANSRLDLRDDRRLRIGYVSGDFYAHPVGYFLSRVLPSHDRASVEVFCYYNNVVHDSMTARLKAASDHWRDIAGMADADADALIRRDGIDILIDLSGHTDKNRLRLFALRAAPIQVSWLGYFGTTGLAAMDYVLMDAISAPPGDEDWYSEAVVRLPYGRFCYEAPIIAPAPVDPPCLRQGHVTFGSFNHVAKITPATVELWAGVLKAVPGSRLLLKWKSLNEENGRRRLQDAFAAAGVPADRLELRGHSPHGDMLAEYGDMDIALDPFPFGGGLTSCEALWMGVPVITLPGDRPAARQTRGFLHQLGLDDLVASTPDGYVTRAASLAGDPARLAGLRQSMRSRMIGSPLCNGSLFTATLDRSFREMWRRFCRDEKAVAFDVPPLTYEA